MDRVFLDANVLFSAAWSETTGLLRLWDLEDVQLLTSAYALEEARVNLPDSARIGRLERLLVSVELVPEAYERRLTGIVDLPPKDRPILLAAVAGRATHLVTGDLRHFGPLFGRTIEEVVVLTPAAYLSQR